MHGATGFGVVGAVIEAAILLQRVQVCKGFFQADGDIGQLNFAHPGRIQNGATARQNMQLPPGGGVATLVVTRADILGGDGLIASQRIGQGRFAHPR